MEIDQQFVEYIIKSLVSKPEAVKVDRSVDERGVLLELTVDPEDLGRVIGKRGATAQSLRTLLRALGTKNDARYNLKIIDTGPPPTRDEPGSITNSSDRSDDHVAPADEPTASASDNQTQATPAEEPVEPEDQVETEHVEPEEEARIEAEAPSHETEDDDESDLASKTRRELAELDDLDV